MGDLDTTFGIGGKVITDFSNNYDSGNSVAIQADGKIVLGGNVYKSVGNTDFALARYNTNGELDTTFGIGGNVITDFSNNYDSGNSVAIQADGKIVLGGSVGDNFGLARYNTNGELDTTFGIGGKVITNFSNSYDYGNSVAIQADGKIVLGGSMYGEENDRNFALARYNINGSLDTTFGDEGKVITDFSNSYDYGNSVAIQQNGKIVLGGYVYNSVSSYDFALARYNTNGELDTTFGIGGKVITDFSNNEDIGFSVAIQQDGKIVFGGYVFNSVSSYDFALARYNTNGELDTTFGDRGKVITVFSNNEDGGFSVAIQKDGKIVLGGVINSLGNYNFGLARYNTNGELDTTFGIEGKVITDFNNNDDIGYTVAIQEDGKIVLGGYVVNSLGNYDFALARYLPGPIIISNICFAFGTPITTDQGNILIQNINTDYHTINNKKIICVTKTLSMDSHLVCFEKNSLANNIPNNKTITSRFHGIYINDELVRANDLVNNESIHKIEYNEEILYNILMEDHEKVSVNNMICETLHPTNYVAQLYRVMNKLDHSERERLIKEVNRLVVKNKTFALKLKIVQK